MKKIVLASDVMVTDHVTLDPQMDVFDGISRLIKRGVPAAPVVDRERNYLGVLNETRCIQVLVDSAYEQLPTTKVEAFMDRSAKAITEEVDLLGVAELFLRTPYRILPVVSGQQLVGVVTCRLVMLAAEHLIRDEPQRHRATLYLSALKEGADPPA